MYVTCDIVACVYTNCTWGLRTYEPIWPRMEVTKHEWMWGKCKWEGQGQSWAVPLLSTAQEGALRSSQPPTSLKQTANSSPSATWMHLCPRVCPQDPSQCKVLVFRKSLLHSDHIPWVGDTSETSSPKGWRCGSSCRRACLPSARPWVQTPVQKEKERARYWWLMSIILAIQEAEIRRIEVWSQPRQIVHKTLSLKNPLQKRAGGGVAPSIGPEFKLQYCKKKKKINHKSKNFKWASHPPYVLVFIQLPQSVLGATFPKAFPVCHMPTLQVGSTSTVPVTHPHTQPGRGWGDQGLSYLGLFFTITERTWYFSIFFFFFFFGNTHVWTQGLT
jgi:hypothetical protein